jgi:hypothetical protein
MYLLKADFNTNAKTRFIQHSKHIPSLLQKNQPVHFVQESNVTLLWEAYGTHTHTHIYIYIYTYKLYIYILVYCRQYVRFLIV